MFTAPILIAGLLTTTLAAPQPVRPTLVSQLSSHASQVAPGPAQPEAAKPRTDHKWDGALAGALAGAGAGAVTGILIYGKGDGEWPDQHVVVGSLTFYGALIGGVTGLVIDLVKK